MKTLLKGKYIEVFGPTKPHSEGVNLLRVELACACCLHKFSHFEIMSDRLIEWEDKVKNEKKFQPLCGPCVKAHKKWHPEKEQIIKALKILESAPKLQAPAKIEDVFIYSEFLDKLKLSIE
jgi:hypothetical protein